MGIPTLSSLPPWLSRWFGVRNEPPAALKPVWVSYVWAFVGAFLGLAALQGVFHAPYFVLRAVPQLIPSYGATAVLCYGLPEAPLAQPRAVVGGHFISALVGINLMYMFGLDGEVTDGVAPDANTWAAAALATAIAIVLMQATKTTHPPAGATALLPIVSQGVNRLSWYYLPVVLLSSLVMVVVAMITNNMQRRYPVYWWEPPASNKAPQAELLPVARWPSSVTAARSSETPERTTEDFRKL